MRGRAADQVLFELRIPGGDSLSSTQLDYGTGGPPYYGWLGYVHGPGLDAPLALIDGRFSERRIVNANWRGLAESSVWPDGSAADCSLMSGTCTTIAWPAGQGVYFRPVPQPVGAPTATWVGSLVVNGADGTGLLYRRNRYYDPASGRFTQEDPIGLAGGLNLYGFAGGDPVNFSDPFGLFPFAKDGIPCTFTFGVAGAAGGFAVGVAASVAAAVPTAGGSLVLSPATVTGT